jgi:hypothetical protein
MRPQYIIVTGTITWLAGCLLDARLIQYAYLPIITGTLVAFVGTIIWLRKPENRIQLKETFRPNTKIRERLKEAFNPKWKTVSIVWTSTALVGMLVVHISAILMRTMGPYDSAVRTINRDKDLLEKIGEIKDFTYMVTGNSTTDGFSKLYFGVIGTNESIHVEAVIEGRNGIFTTDKIVVHK